MKKILLKLLFTFLFIIIATTKAFAVQFNVLVLPTELFSVCDNYFCFPEVSEIASEDIIRNLNSYKNITAIELANVRSTLEQDQALKQQTSDMLNQFENTDKIDFQTLKLLSEKFNVKSVLLVSTFSTNDKTNIRRNLWETLEISSAFKISYPFTLVTSAVLTDTVNNVVMWSGKYNKNISDSNGYFSAENQAQAASQLEKIKQYYKNNVAQTISQNIHLRFFPKEIRTFNIAKPQSTEEQPQPQFVPNALDNLIKPQMEKELDNANTNSTSPTDDFIFEF